MSLPVFQATIVNDSGDIIPSAVMTVLDEITGLGLTVYSNRAGTIPLGTNGVFTAGTDGFAQFFAPAGNYRVKAEQAASGFEKTWDFVPLVGGSAFDVDSYKAFGIGTTGGVDGVPVNTLGGQGFSYEFVTNATDDPFDNNRGSIVTMGATGSSNRAQIGVAFDSPYNMYLRGRQTAPWQPVYTGANYQPEISSGLAVVRLMRLVSGVGLADGALVPLAGVEYCRFSTAGALLSTGVAAAGIWRNVTGTPVNNLEYGMFERES